MKLNLDKKDLISMVKGISPNDIAESNPLIKKNGSYSASYSRWSWSYGTFEKYSEEELYEIYMICKNSWE